MISTSTITPSSSTSILLFSTPQINLTPNSKLIITSAASNSKLGSFFTKFSRNSLSSKSLTQIHFKVPNSNGFSSQHSIYNPSSSKRLFQPVMEMQDCTVQKEVDVPISVAYNCYLDRESIPKWMPFISTVKVLEDKPDQSRWTLRYRAFGQDLEFSWLARNLQPIPNQKIHWRSLEGLPNSGAVRFYPRGPSSCLLEVRTPFCLANLLTVSYEVPSLLTPVASALKPFLESLLLRGLERFSNFAKNSQAGLTS